MSTAIRIENLWKEYRLGVIGHGTLTQDLQSWWARLRGKEDPNSKIPTFAGQEKQIEGNRFWALSDINTGVNNIEALIVFAGRPAFIGQTRNEIDPTQDITHYFENENNTDNNIYDSAELND